ncbi:MAG: DUF5606 domain-containing protein [Bacteroidota bacterium]
MDLTKVISISGVSGLHKVIAKSTNGFIVESLTDGKRMNASSSSRISGLEEISVFTTGEDILLKDVYKRIFEKEKGGPAIDHKSSDEELKKYFESVLPEYDKDRVRVSDIRKCLQWYNILQKTDLLTKEPEKTDEKLLQGDDTKEKFSNQHTETKQHLNANMNVAKKTTGVRKIGGGS